MEPVFVTNEPALVFENRGERILIVSDLHIGIENEYYQRSMRIPSQTRGMVKRLERLVQETRADRLVILGDIKHKVPGISRQELRELPEFFGRFNGRVKVDVVPGNHDSGIRDWLPEGVRLHKSSGFRIGDLFLVHGHGWPPESFTKAKFVVTGHSHPQIEFRDKLGYRWSEPVWLRAKLKTELMKKRYKQATGFPEIIVMPCFNNLSGGMAVNRKPDPGQKQFLGPLLRRIHNKTAKVYMLDGVFLGELGKL